MYKMTRHMRARSWQALHAFVIILLLQTILTGCGPSNSELEAVDYTPISSNLWSVSTPEEQDFDPKLLAELFQNASQLETVYSLLVFKNGYLIAEDYFDVGSPELQVNIHSVTKSLMSALVGIALEQGCLTGVDQKMMDFFPELQPQISDPRKNDITVRQLLQMRAGFPWEESTPELFELLTTGFHNDTLVHVPLVRDPGSDSEYSNLSPHILGIIVARACGTDLLSFATDHLFTPLGIEPGFWQQDWDGNYLGFSDLELSSTDLAKFGLMLANGGVYAGEQIVPADWIEDTLAIYSEGTWKIRVGRNWKDNAYGYQWWSIRAGDYRYNLAWGHGGQQIVLLDELDMVIVLLVDPLHMQWGDEPWRIEKNNLNLVADFVASIPGS